MIKQIIEKNENTSVNTKEIEFIKEKFPFCFDVNGDFDIEKFKEILKDKINITNEGYELKFLGKNYARLLASLDTTTVIEPDIMHNEKNENKNSENIYISGDNLDGLKHLLNSYLQKIKVIYIDIKPTRLIQTQKTPLNKGDFTKKISHPIGMNKKMNLEVINQAKTA